MRGSRLWDLAFGGALVVLAVIAAFSWGPFDFSRWGVWATLAALALCYFVFGRLSVHEDRFTAAFIVVLVVGAGILAVFQPTQATFQAIALPVLWCIGGSLYRTIVLNVLLVTSVAIGTTFSLGSGADAMLQAAITAALSLIFSLALGLWFTRVAEYGDERARLLKELISVQDKLAAANREAGVASERERLSREIHDTIAQSLTSLVMLAQRARAELSRGDLGRHDIEISAIAESVDLIETTARDALTEARSLVAALAPLPVGESSLAEVMNRLTARFTRETGMSVTASVAAADIPRDLEVVLLRCAQEGLANVRKHAQASEALVSVSRQQSGVRLEVHDNGRGLSGYAPDAERGFGLNGMRDRVALVGGELEISDAPGAGTTLVVTIPVSQEVSV